MGKVIFFTYYLFLSKNLKTNITTDLADNINEFASVYNLKSKFGLKNEFKSEIDSDGNSYWFFQFVSSDSSLIFSTDGNGLGLSLAHTIVKTHGGKIEVSSKADDGTLFTVYLPVY